MSAEVVALQPLRARLPKADPAEAAVRNRALALLSGLAFDDEGRTLSVAAAPGATGPGGWLRFETGLGPIGLAPRTIAGQPVPLLPDAAAPDLPAALHQLSRLEPLIAAVERTLGLPLDPTALGPAFGVVLELRATDADGALVHHALLAVDPGCAAAWPDPLPPAELGLAGAATARLAVRLGAPAVPAAELGNLRTGDLVLLPRHAATGWACDLLAAGRPLAAGDLDLLTRHLTIRTLETAQMLETALRDGEAAPAPTLQAQPAEARSFAPAPATGPTPDVGALTVRLKVALGDVPMPLKVLAALRPGSVVTLPFEGEDLAVELLADDRAIATGRLVSLGDSYGVMIDRVRAA